jgi:hypothetical protein
VTYCPSLQRTYGPTIPYAPGPHGSKKAGPWSSPCTSSTDKVKSAWYISMHPQVFTSWWWTTEQPYLNHVIKCTDNIFSVKSPPNFLSYNSCIFHSHKTSLTFLSLFNHSRSTNYDVLRHVF